MTDSEHTSEILEVGRDVLRQEADAVSSLADRTGDDFVECCQVLSKCTGHIIVIGMGKSGHIGQKIAATFASTGSPSFFVHPAEASHGDLGMITRNDVVLTLSFSGETEELLNLLPLVRQIGATIIALTGQPESTLARKADLHLEIPVAREACPLNLAPTSSTTATLAMGDALAVALMHVHGFKPEDFASTHPGGNLGRQLLTTVRDVMREGEKIPKVAVGTLLRDALPEISEKGLGMTTVLDENGRVVGVFTDGDLRRCLADAVDVHVTTVDQVMTQDFQTAAPDELARDVLHRMRDRRFNAAPVMQDKQLVGVLNMHDLVAAGLR